jgi:alanine racemase
MPSEGTSRPAAPASEGAFTELTEDQEFDREQAARLESLAQAARARGLALGVLHAASSDAIVKPTGDTFLDLVRPGLALYGGYPSAESWARGGLRPACRPKARVIRLDRLEPGESVSYHRGFTAAEPTRVATLGPGHVDGYPAGAVRGCEALIRERLYPVSHLRRHAPPARRARAPRSTQPCKMEQPTDPRGGGFPG